VLDEGSGEAPGISDLAGQLTQALAGISRIDASQAGLYEQALTLAETVSEISREMQDYLEQIEFNPRRLEQVEERLDLIHRLKRKYGNSIEAVLAFGKDAQEKLDRITHSGERIAEMEAEEAKVLEKLGAAGAVLSQQRKADAQQLSQAVERELADLSMAGARFMVEIRHEVDTDGVPLDGGRRLSFDETGFDRVEFLISPNPGEDLKPLVKIASGGETSRLMLALKNVLAQADYVPTLVFDEIDQGIGGRVGSIVGEKLWQLGLRHQVLCVTHLPQLAAFGVQHFHVRKLVQEGRTSTRVEPLEGETRLDELALMLGNLSEANRSAARETLENAAKRTKELATRSS